MAAPLGIIAKSRAAIPGTSIHSRGQRSGGHTGQLGTKAEGGSSHLATTAEQLWELWAANLSMTAKKQQSGC